MGTFDGVLIKNNHLAFHASIGKAVQRARAAGTSGMGDEVEVHNPDELEEAVPRHNISVAQQLHPGANEAGCISNLCWTRLPLESSGGITSTH